MRIIRIIIFMFCISSIYSQNKWELSYRNIGLPKVIQVLDSTKIYLMSLPSSLYKSTDQGKNWEVVYNNFSGVENCTDMSIPDSNTFFISFAKGNLYRSLDAGKTFENIIIPDVAYVKSISMVNQDVGIIAGGYFITKDSWKSYYKFDIETDSIRLKFSNSYMVNDSIAKVIVGNSRGKKGGYFLELNINTLQHKLNWIGTDFGSADITYLNNNIFVCGWSNSITGGSSHDVILKSTDGGKNWRRVLDLYSKGTKFYTTSDDIPPFGLQSIAFKDSMTGIAVGQFGKIVYTYDGGESWIYESQYHDSLGEPPTMIVRYAGSVPIIATFDEHIYRLVEDNLAPKPEDTITISGRVWEGNKGQPGIPVVLGYRVTMTDSNGYYKFTRVAKGNYIVHAENKYYDGGNPSYYYRPFNYIPERYDFYLTSDTSGIDFNAIDLRTFYSVSGEIVTSGGKGLKDIQLTIGDSSTISTEDGKFIFPKIEQKRTYELIPYSKEYKFTPWAYSINIDKDIDTFRFVAIPITSVEENEEMMGSIEISPNPATDYITINSPSIKRGQGGVLELNENSRIEIYDVMGVLIHSTPFNLTPALSEGEGVRIDVSNLNPGVYFIKIGDKVEKFIKM